jgi:DegV family protein with EDD domain
MNTPAPITLVTDSTCDLPHELITALKMHVVPVLINLTNQSLRDGVDISREQFYGELAKTQPYPTTSACSSNDFAQIFESIDAQSEILCVTLSQKLSGMYNAARLAMEQTGRKVHLFDSEHISMGLGWQVLAAAEAIANGDGVQTVLEKTAQVRQKVRTFAVLTTLEFARRSGRVSALQAGLGNLLNLCPILHLNDGLIKPYANQRTFKKAVGALRETVEKLAPLNRLAVMHANASTAAHELAEKLQVFCAHSVQVVPITPAVGLHTGPGALGVALVAAE